MSGEVRQPGESKCEGLDGGITGPVLAREEELEDDFMEEELKEQS